ncbi:MAG: glycosyltransferase family 39 protein [Candidatus Scalindua sp.]|nr:glycosyltransferase family 39 protein [Candidatus Scalindua sp.]MCR4345141.1 glycosyltransferase family 39 protein [Candidatus Scalindua sp.]
MQKTKLILCSSRYWFVAIILVLSFVGIFDHDLWTADEPRVAEIGREFFDEGVSLAVPQLNGEVFMEKPPLYFWCVALSYKIFGGPSASAARIPSVLFGFGTLIFTYLLARKMYDRKTAGWSCMVLALSAEFFYIHHKSLVDTSLVFFVTGTVYWLYLALTAEVGEKGGYYTLCYIFATGAFFAKGFIGLAFPVLLFVCLILWRRNWLEIKRARLWIGFLIVGSCISLWFWFLWKEGSWEYISTFLIHNNFQRIIPGVGSEYSGGHVKPFYYYLFKFWRAFAPWSILVPAVFFYACRKGFQDKNRLFLVLWFCTGLLMLSLAGTKRTIYIVPLIPAISILTGSWLNDVESGLINGRFARVSQWLILCGCGVLVLALAGVVFKLALYKTAPFVLLWPVVTIGYVFAFRSFVKNRVIKLCGLPVTISLIYVMSVLVFVPYINKANSFRPFCGKLGEILAAKESTLYAFQPEETTRAVVPFYTGRKLLSVNDLNDVKSLPRDNNVLMLVLDKHKDMRNYNSLKTLFPDVILSEVVGKRRNFKLLSN